MPASRFVGELRRLLALTLLVSHSAACYRWQAVGPTPAEYLQGHQVDAAQVTRADSSVVELWDPRVAGDSLTGLLPGSPPGTNASVSVPLADVRRLAVRKGDTGRTIALIGGGVAVLGLIGCLTTDCGTGVE